MRFRLTPRSMTLDDLELCTFEFFREFMWISDATAAKRLKIDQYCQRQRCKQARRIGAIFGMLSRRAGLLATAGLSCISELLGRRRHDKSMHSSAQVAVLAYTSYNKKPSCR